MEIFSALLAICAGNSPVTGEFPTQRPVTRSFDVYGWVNNGEAGDLRRYLAHYDVIVMYSYSLGLFHWHCGNHTIAPIGMNDIGHYNRNKKAEFLDNGAYCTAWGVL